MPPRLCCCPAPCLLHSDDFNRANANPPTGRWVVVSGEWELNTNRIRSITPGPLITTKRQPPSTRLNTEYSIRIYFRALSLAPGDTFGVICGYEDDDNFAWVEFTVVSTSVFPAFYNRVGGADSLVMDITTHPGGIPFPIDTGGGLNNWDGKICYSQADWTVDNGTSDESGMGIQYVESEHPWTVGTEGGQADLPPANGMVGFLYGEFDNFFFHQHWESKVTCDYCSCLCRNPFDVDDYIALPEVLLVTFVPQFDPDDYPCSLNFATVLIYQVVSASDSDFSPTKRTWSNENISIGAGTPTDTTVILRCNFSGGDSEERFTLALKIPSQSGNYNWGDTMFTIGGIPAAYVEWDISTCDPINLVFGELWADGDTCETIPGGGGAYGYKFPLCVGDGCTAPQTPELLAFLASLRWKLVVTEP